MTTNEILRSTKAAWPALSKAGSDDKNRALQNVASCIEEDAQRIISANKADIEAVRGKISEVMIDRLFIDENRIAGIAAGVRDVAALPDPVGRIISEFKRPNGITVSKVGVPIGTVAIIYESRPNVTADAAALALKSGNACVLRGGKEAFRTNNAITAAIRRGISKAGLPENLVQLIQDTTRASSMELMQAVGFVDLLIPRGGKSLINACLEQAKVPCIQTGTGICHVYVDKYADLAMALDIIDNAKTSRPSVCNAAEVMIVHSAVAGEFLPLVKKRLVDDRKAAGKEPVELRLDERATAVIEGVPAGKDDFDTEFLDYILAVKTVDSVMEAVEHISRHSTGHSEAIVTECPESAEIFTKLVDSAAVYVNASTRFTDGGEFGLGCEMGISTQKLHARGPMGLEELTTYKYVIRGTGQIR